jgi:hypothetical protein
MKKAFVKGMLALSPLIPAAGLAQNENESLSEQGFNIELLESQDIDTTKLISDKTYRAGFDDGQYYGNQEVWQNLNPIAEWVQCNHPGIPASVAIVLMFAAGMLGAALTNRSKNMRERKSALNLLEQRILIIGDDNTVLINMNEMSEEERKIVDDVLNYKTRYDKNTGAALSLPNRLYYEPKSGGVMAIKIDFGLNEKEDKGRLVNAWKNRRAKDERFNDMLNKAVEKKLKEK